MNDTAANMTLHELRRLQGETYARIARVDRFKRDLELATVEERAAAVEEMLNFTGTTLNATLDLLRASITLAEQAQRRDSLEAAMGQPSAGAQQARRGCDG